MTVRLGISPIRKRVTCGRSVGGGSGCFFLEGEVAEADNTSLGH